ncbi:ATP phosphoribosyltransferase regulatory subunit [Thermogymnomonas acidicola]|uniref:ATP phosphoribosyltransferase regulatory subunit n=1 Tax=Thermogymnomonas acidicola TaxID=399579 RepID=UPI00139684F6|nr:ATP phosphoribosyltransferase regulatory subunit [Thermogymnomonas acidicola]
MCTVNPEPYYSGIVFEVYSPRSGVLLGRGGGRYSIGSFSGSGFALDMEAIASLYDNRRGGVERRVITRSDIGRAMVEARRMVSMGIPVEVVP